jgi:hypothetical protein
MNSVELRFIHNRVMTGIQWMMMTWWVACEGSRGTAQKKAAKVRQKL